MDIVFRSRCIKPDPRIAARLERAILQGERKRLRVSVTVVADAGMRRLHRRFLGHDRTTDVIAFDLRDRGRRRVSGDVDGVIVVNAALARREAKKRGHSAQSELLFYVAHGILHLCGYDDGTPSGRAEMLARQARYLGAVGLIVNS